MRRPVLPGLALALALGCGKKPPAPPPAEPEAPAEPAPAEATAERDKLLTTLKTKRGDTQRAAVEALVTLAESDPAVLAAVVDLLRDRTTAGAGKTHPTNITSTREAAAVVLLRCGPKGEAALKDKGFPVLREGLSDKDAAVREHTARTLEVIGPAAKPLLGVPLQRLCSDADPNVRNAAFDALRSVGVADVPALAALLNSETPEIRSRAAEIVTTLPEVGSDAVPSLTRALEDEDEAVRVAAATAIATAGGKGTIPATAPNLAAAIKKSYPEKFDPETARLDGPEFVYWRALAGLGKPAVAPTTELISHKNFIVRMLAIRTLAEFGAEAKPAVETIRKALTDEYSNVALEAACALCKLGENPDDAVTLVRAALASTNPGVAAGAVEAVSRMGAPGKPLVPEALAKLASPLPDARFAAVVFVGELDPDEGAKQLPELTKLLADEEPLIRAQVAMVLEALGPKAAAAAGAVGAALPGEKDEGVRDLLVDALVAMGPSAKPAIAGLVPLVADPSAPVPLRTKVIGAVIVSDPASPDVAAALVKAAGDPEMTVRIAAAHALGKLNPLPDDARSTLVRLARSDSKTETRLAAVRGLVTAGPRAKAAKPDLEALSTGTIPGVDLWAKVGLIAIDGNVTKAGGVVRAALDHKGFTTRSAAAEALLLVGPTAADVPALVKLLKDPSGPGKAAAATALGRIGPAAKEAVPRLADALTDGDAAVRAAAAEALGRIGPAALPAAAKLKEAARTDPATAAAVRKALDRLGVKTDAPPPKS